VLTRNADGSYVASVRAPLSVRRDADRLCRQFPTGGGRSGAAGINALAHRQLPDFLRAFEHIFGQVRSR
jgi:hypothetical protein